MRDSFILSACHRSTTKEPRAGSVFLTEYACSPLTCRLLTMKKRPIKEDLLRDASNYCFRCEIRIPSIASLIFVGITQKRRFSLYFGQDPVYHFDKQCRIRRGFVRGKIFKSESGKLVQLTRKRTDTAVLLQRKLLSLESTTAWLNHAEQAIALLQQDWRLNRFEIVRSVPSNHAVCKPIQEILTELDSTQLIIAPSVRSV